MTPNQQTASIRHLRLAPRKVRSVATLIKGMTVNEATAQLMVTRRRPATIILKLLRSAVANAKQANKFDMEKLYIASIRVDGGTMLHRSLPRARGHADPIQKKSSHVTIVLQEREPKKGNRFNFKAKAKKKAVGPDSDRPRRQAKKDVEEGGHAEGGNNPGFFRKVFSRKTI
jgi:large subunit ribosomal protein L22